jgi:hypothetical protein
VPTAAPTPSPDSITFDVTIVNETLKSFTSDKQDKFIAAVAVTINVSTSAITLELDETQLGLLRRLASGHGTLLTITVRVTAGFEKTEVIMALVSDKAAFLTRLHLELGKQGIKIDKALMSVTAPQLDNGLPLAVLAGVFLALSGCCWGAWRFGGCKSADESTGVPIFYGCLLPALHCFYTSITALTNMVCGCPGEDTAVG